MSVRRTSRKASRPGGVNASSTREARLPGSDWEVEVNPDANMAYIWFAKPSEGTYVDYTCGLDEDIAYAIRSVGDDRVVGIFVTDLSAALQKAKELEEKRRQQVALGLLAQTRWSDMCLSAASRAANSTRA